MSNPAEESKESISAMARAAQDRPIPVTVLGRRGAIAQVRGPGASVIAPFPANRLYRLDEALLTKLVAAYHRGDRAELDRLWAEGTHHA